jgi:hypothetical protein
MFFGGATSRKRQDSIIQEGRGKQKPPAAKTLGINEAFTFDAHFLTYRYGPGKQRVFRCLP